MGTTTDKLNRLIETKEGIRQEINRIYGAEEVSTSDTFNSYIQKLEDNPFYLLGCIERNIKSVKVSDVTALGKSAFQACKNLTSVSFPNVTTIGDHAFRICTDLVRVSFPKATSIGVGTFYGCTDLVSVTFPNVTSLGNDAFRYCSNLTIASFPKLTQIDAGSTSWLKKSGAFLECAYLTTLYIGTETSTVCTLGKGALQGCDSLTDIYVPASLVDSYKSATNWSNYADKIKAAF